MHYIWTQGCMLYLKIMGILPLISAWKIKCWILSKSLFGCWLKHFAKWNHPRLSVQEPLPSLSLTSVLWVWKSPVCWEWMVWIQVAASLSSSTCCWWHDVAPVWSYKGCWVTFLPVSLLHGEGFEVLVFSLHMGKLETGRRNGNAKSTWETVGQCPGLLTAQGDAVLLWIKLISLPLGSSK